MRKFPVSKVVSLLVGMSIMGVCLTTVSATVLYRGLSAASNGKVSKLTARSFRFDPNAQSSAVLELSTFDSISAASAATVNAGYSPHNCYLKFETEAQASNVPVSGLGSYRAIADGGVSGVPPGHWSIVAPSGVAADAAGSAVIAYANNNPNMLASAVPPGLNCRW